MDGPALLRVGSGLVVDGLAQEVEHASQALVTDRDCDRPFGVDRVDAADQTIGGAHRDTADDIVADLLRHLGDQSAAINIDFDGIEQCRQLPLLETDIKDRAGDLYYLADMFFTH